MADPLTPEQADRVRQALKELIPKLGVPPTAKALGVRPVDLVSLGSGRQEMTPEIAQGVADLKKVTLEELLGPSGDAAAVDPLPKRAEAIELARKDGAQEEAIAAVLKNPPPGSESWSRFDWLVAIKDHEKPQAPKSASVPPPAMQAPLPVGTAFPQQPALIGVPSAVVAPTVEAPPRSMATPMPSPASVAQPIPPSPANHQPSWPPKASAAASPTPASPFEAQPAVVAAEPATPYESVLTIYEFASLSMGLELLPHRVDDVYASFGLTSAEQRAGEHAHWDDYLSKSPKERRELPAMRERMRMHWLRFDGQVARPSAAPAPIVEAAPPPVVVAPVPPAANPDEPPVPLITYAAICAELRLTPHRSEDIFAFYGLPDPARRTIVAEFWETRRRTNPIEDQEFQRLFWEKHQQLEQLALRTSQAAPMPKTYAAAVAAVAPAGPLPPLTLDLDEYAQMSMRLEKEKDKEAVYHWFGLKDLRERAALEQEWQRRLAADPALRAEWQRKKDELAADWFDFDAFQ